MENGDIKSQSSLGKIPGYEMDMSYMFCVIGVILLLIILLIIVVYTQNLIILLVLLIIVLIFLPNIILGLKSIPRIIRGAISGTRTDYRHLADGIFQEWHSLEIIGSKPNRNVIYLAKYPDSFPEYLASQYLDPVVCIAKAPPEPFKSMFRGYYNPQHWIPYKSGQNSFEYIKSQIRDKIKTSSIFAYPEEHVKKKRGVVFNFRSGLFKIAKELNIPIVPVVVEYLPIQYVAQPRTQHIWLGSPIDPSVNSIEEMMAKTHNFMLKYTKS